MTDIPLVIAEPTGLYRRMLRRFCFPGRCEVPCTHPWNHDAVVHLGDVTEAEHNEVHGDNWDHGDSRWPKACGHCGYEFREGDPWQRNDSPTYRLPSGQIIVNWGMLAREAPPGTAMRAPWFDEHSGHPDGIESWRVMLPDGGEWITSQKARDGGYWKVTGTMPCITVSPSIWHNQPAGWHGFIRDGVLQGC